MSSGYQLSKTDTHICSIQHKRKNAWLVWGCIIHTHSYRSKIIYKAADIWCAQITYFKKHDIPKSRLNKSNRFRQIKIQLITLQNISSLNERIQSCFCFWLDRENWKLNFLLWQKNLGWRIVWCALIGRKMLKTICKQWICFVSRLALKDYQFR